MTADDPTPQLKKLGIKPGLRLVVVGKSRRLGRSPNRSRTSSSSSPGPTDVALVFVRERAQIDFATWGQWIFPAGSVWVAWPRKAAGHVSDVDENAIRDAALELGLVDVKVAAIDTDWSGLKIVWRKENRG